MTTLVLFALVLLATLDRTQSLDKGEIVCRTCGARIANLDDEINPQVVGGGADAPSTRSGDMPKLQRFKNPNKIPFDVFTVSKAESRPVGEFESGATFFDNYEWQIVKCPVCGSHIGWKYRRQRSLECAQPSAPIDNVKTRSKTTPTQIETKLHQPLGEDEGVDVEAFTVGWVLKALEGVCIEKTFGFMKVKWCRKKDVTVTKVQKPSDRFVIARYDEEVQRKYLDSQTSIPFFRLGGKKRYIYPLFLNGGDLCTDKEEKRHSSIIINLMCCDSYSISEVDIELIQAKLLRIEQFHKTSNCMHTMTVCVPKLCHVPGYEFDADAKKLKQKTRGTPEAGGDSRFAQRSLTEKPSTHLKAACPGGPLQFYGLIWDSLLLAGSQETIWMDSIGTSLSGPL
mmetsp:Transcript_10335/g.22395  ORF Transcript_10335/g.22395 Transcript_10335/m.22395 type:complete len:397 (-) Transcript_10335:1744-2934(-)